MLRSRRIAGIDNLNHFLQGCINGSTDLTKMNDSLYLNGLTLIFTSPAAETVTFSSAGDQVPLSIADVISQIEAQTTGVVAKVLSGQLYLIEETPNSGVAITEAGTANTKLGFNNAVATTGRVYGAVGGAAPSLNSVVNSGPDAFLVITEET